MTSSSCLLRLVPLVLVSSIVVGAIQSAHAVTGECPIEGFNSEIIEQAARDAPPCPRLAAIIAGARRRETGLAIP